MLEDLSTDIVTIGNPRDPTRLVVVQVVRVAESVGESDELGDTIEITG